MKFMKRRGLRLFAAAAFLPVITAGALAQGNKAATALHGAIAMSAENTAITAQLTQKVRDFLANVPKGDKKVFDDFFADDVIYTRSVGVTVDKAEILKNIGVHAASEPQATFEADGFTVHAYGDTAVVNFRLVMHNVNTAIATLHGLKSLGIVLSVDDFGTGYSSLSYLKQLPFDTLKIDRSFVRGIGAGEDPDEGAIAQAIISLGHSLRLKVIAEGVETDAQVRFLKRHGCDEVQGFLYGEPVAPEDYAQLLEKAKRKGKRA